MGRFRSQPVGMDIDRSSIKGVQISKSGGGYALQHVGYRRLPPGAIADGEVADHDLLAEEIKQFWATHSFKGKTLLLGIANQNVVVRMLDFPRMDPDELSSAIGFEAQDHIPMPLDEAVLDYTLLGPSEEGSDLNKILIVAAQKDMVGRYTSAVRAAGLRPLGVDVKALSLMRSTLPEALFEDEGAVLLLDIGAEITNLVVSQGGTPTLTRFIPGGTSNFVQAIADTASISEEEAEKQLMNPRLAIGDVSDEEFPAMQVSEEETPEERGSEGDAWEEAGEEVPEEAPGEAPEETPEEVSGETVEEPTGESVEEEPTGEAEEEAAEEDGEGEEDSYDPALMYDVRRGIEDAVQILAEDVQRSIEYHYSQPGAGEVSQVFVSGEGELVSGMETYLGELLGITAHRANPLRRLTANRSNVTDEQLQVMEPVLAVALGLVIEEA